MSSLAVSGPADAPARRHAPVAAPRVEELGPAALAAEASAWDDLAGMAAVPAPFFTRRVVEAHQASGLAGDIRILVARRGARWLAALPFRSGWPFGLGRSVNVAWRSPFTPSADPLVAGDDPEAAIALLLDGFAARPGLWLLPRLTLDDRLGAAIRQESARRGWCDAVLDPFDRAVLDARPDWPAYLAALEPRRRKEMARRRRRLAALGDVTHEAAGDGPDLDAAIAAFLALEAQGWKGLRGSAMASRPRTARLARELFGKAGSGIVPRADLLRLDGRAVAVSLALVCGGTCFMLKAAYDETLTRASPGKVLEDEIVRALHATGFARGLNSVAEAGSHLEAIYPDRVRIGDLVVASDPAIGRAALDKAVAGEATRRRVLRRGKDVYWRLRGLRAG